MTQLLRRASAVAVAVLLAVCIAAGVNAVNSPKQMNNTPSAADTAAANDVVATIHTTAGDVTVRLYGDTPGHTRNFVKLAREGFYDGVLFHRVINDFMVQTGDPDSKNAPKGKVLGMGGPGYDIDAEIVYPRHFHRRGALAAAREGDMTNPERRSSGSQFYIVTGRVYNPQQLAQMEQRRIQENAKAIFDRLSAGYRDSIMAMRRNRDAEGLEKLRSSLADKAVAEAKADSARMAFTPEQTEAYTTVGGTPHLDGTYSVFGEVISGMDVVDRIQKASTDRNDRPTEDILIKSITIDSDPASKRD